MTVKQFFKSNIFKCLAALLCVLLVCGVFLTIMNGLLAVSDEEKFQRVLSEIYGKSVTTKKQDVSDKNTNLSSAIINDVYKVEDDGNYIVNASGKNGYGGNVKCWVVILTKPDGKSVGGVGKVTAPIADNPAESFLNKIGASVYDKFAKDYKDGIVYSYGKDENDKEGEMFVKTDASYSMRGICNAVNGTITFMNAFLSGGDIEEEDPYEDFAYHTLINMEDTSWTKNGKEITYNVVTKGNGEAESFKISVTVGEDKKIKTYAITVNGSTFDYDADMNPAIKDGSLFVGKDLEYFKSIIGEDGGKTDDPVIATGATKSNYLCFAAGAFAVANYDYIQSLKEFDAYIDVEETTCTVSGTDVIYEITTKGNGEAESFKISVTVGEDKKIKTYAITVNGSTFDYDADMNPAIKDGSLFVGKDLDYFKSIIGADGNVKDNAVIATGATKSNYLCFAAGAFAIANYDYYLNNAEGGAENE